MSTQTSDKYLVCKGTSGMGNRILAACTALLYGEIANRKVIIDWRDKSYSEGEENAFPKFFDCPTAYSVESLPETENVYPKVWAGNLYKSLGGLQNELNLNPESDMSLDVAKIDYLEELVVFCAYTHKTGRLRSHFQGKYAAYEKLTNSEILKQTLNAKLHLTSEISGLVEDFRNINFDENTIGVHVRYTDMKVPLEKLLALAHRLLKSKKDGIVFLATDSQEVITQFREQFPKVITIEKWFPEDGQRLHQNWDACPDRFRNGVEALMDLYLLAACNHLIFSSQSSFGYTASLLSEAKRGNIHDVELDNSLMQRFQRKSKELLHLFSGNS